MTGKERIMATLRGEKVDRLSVNFYEINGYIQNEHNPRLFQCLCKLKKRM